MVLALSPAVRPTSIKVAPIESFGFEELCASASNRGPGRARPKTSLNESTIAERLSDLRNHRREEDKRENTFPGFGLATIRRYFYSERLRDCTSLRRGSDLCRIFRFASTENENRPDLPPLATFNGHTE